MHLPTNYFPSLRSMHLLLQGSHRAVSGTCMSWSGRLLYHSWDPWKFGGFTCFTECWLDRRCDLEVVNCCQESWMSIQAFSHLNQATNNLNRTTQAAHRLQFDDWLQSRQSDEVGPRLTAFALQFSSISHLSHMVWSSCPSASMAFVISCRYKYHLKSSWNAYFQCERGSVDDACRGRVTFYLYGLLDLNLPFAPK